jgi:hypothetical protein
VGVIPDGTSSAALFRGNVGTAGVDAGLNVKFSTDGGATFFAINALSFPVGTSLGWAAPASSVSTIWIPSASTYTITAHWIITAGTSCSIANAKLIAYEF